MAPILKLLLGLALICSLTVGGDRQCSKNSLKITQYRTGETFRSKPVWRVKITNDCPCTQLDVKLSCKGFQTVKEVDIDPNKPVLAKSGDECLLNDGRPIYAHKNFSFIYAFGTQCTFRPLSSRIACSWEFEALSMYQVNCIRWKLC